VYREPKNLYTIFYLFRVVISMNQTEFDTVVANLENIVSEKFPESSRKKLLSHLSKLKTVESHRSLTLAEEITRLADEIIKYRIYCNAVADTASAFAKEYGLKFNPKTLYSSI